MNEVSGTPCHCCDAMRNAVADPEIPVVFSAKFREYGILVLDGGTSYILIAYCPWCLHKLPSSLRDTWMEEIRIRGFEPGDPQIPPEFSDERWYQGR